MSLLVRWFAPVAVAAGLGAAALVPGAARADDELVRVIVDAADVILRGGDPYYRDGRHGDSDRLVVERDRHGRPVYYRHVSRAGRGGGHHHRRSGPPAFAPAHGYRTSHGRHGREATRCDRQGRCTVQYYDPRYDRGHKGRRR